MARDGAAREQHGVTVRRRLGDAARAGHAAGAGHVLDHDLLAEDFAQPRGENARERVDRAAGGVRHDHGHRAGRPILRACGEGCEQERDRRDGSNHSRHDVLPRVREVEFAWRYASQPFPRKLRIHYSGKRGKRWPPAGIGKRAVFNVMARLV